MGRKLARPMPGALQRISEALGTADIASIAEALQLPYGTVRNWHQRGRVPLSGLDLAAGRTGLTVDYLMFGNQDGAKKFDPLSSEINQIGTGGANSSKVNQTGASDAFPDPPAAAQPDLRFSVPAGAAPSPAAPMDANLMREVIEEIGDELNARGLRLPGAKLAELVLLIYDHLASEFPQKDEVEQTTRRYLRLVA